MRIYVYMCTWRVKGREREIFLFFSTSVRLAPAVYIIYCVCLYVSVFGVWLCMCMYVCMYVCVCMCVCVCVLCVLCLS